MSHWPADGVPANPQAWLLTAARHRALDGFRHQAIEASARAAYLQAIGLEMDSAVRRLLQRRAALVESDWVREG